jgi:glycine/D-amino acid oxidase-like deaminating enzyme
MDHPWFKGLPFAPSKGETILIESEELTNQHIFKKSMTVVPLFSKNLFWVGSSYEWEFSHPNPTPEFLEKTKFHLDTWLKVPYKIIDHKAALRPSTLERRPFVGFHPQNPSLGILNGMGTKGASLTPYFAHQLARHIVNGTPITPEADINRFQRILSK